MDAKELGQFVREEMHLQATAKLPLTLELFSALIACLALLERAEPFIDYHASLKHLKCNICEDARQLQADFRTVLGREGGAKWSADS